VTTQTVERVHAFMEDVHPRGRTDAALPRSPASEAEHAPPVVGETAQQAVTDLEGAGFSVTQQYVAVADPSQDGIVQSQSPEGGSQATKGSTVTIVIGQHSPGPPPTTTTTG